MHKNSKKHIDCPVIKIHSLGSCIYADMFRHIDLGIIVLDIKEESVAFQNKAALNIFNTEKNPFDYKTLSTLLLQGMGEGSIEGGLAKQRTIHYKDKLLGYSLYIISEKYVTILIRDITENARLESIAEAFNTMDNITYIFSGLRHELGNPINSIKMTLSVLRANLDTYSRENIQKYVNRTLGEISRVEYLLQSLKSFSMFENPMIQNVDLPDFIGIFLSLVENDLKKSGVKIKLMLSSEAQWIRADPRALQQAMLNLISNATDALEGRANPTIGIRTVKKNGLIWINVEDNGCGISREYQKRLFKPFYTTKSHGTGLGLVITKKMLSKMNSRIGIESRENVGTTVTISIPTGHAEDV